MVGDRIRTGGGPAELNTAELNPAQLNHSHLAAGLRADYDAAAGDWAGGLTGPGSMYEPLAQSLVAAAPVPLAGGLVLDWEQPGRGAPLSDLAWYLAINCRRLPQSKQASIAAYREALESCGIDTEPWWDRQLALCLLGAMVLFGWEKALGGYDEELAWWETESVRAAALLN